MGAKPNPYRTPAADTDGVTALTSRSDVATPDAFSRSPAGFWLRLAATSIDVLVAAPLLYWSATFVKPEVVRWPLIAILAGFLLPDLLLDAYNIVAHRLWGKTFGKFVCRISVVRAANGQLLGWGQAFLRTLPWLALGLPFSLLQYLNFQEVSGRGLSDESFMVAWRAVEESTTVALVPGLLALAWVLLSVALLLLNSRKRTIHDFMAGTCVVRDRPRQRSG